MSLTWEEILRRDDIVGGDLESQEDGDFYRGPIASIERQGDSITITPYWIAKLNRKEGVSHNLPITPLYFRMEDCPPQDIGNGRIIFHIPFIGIATIFPKGGSKLDPNRVEGLKFP